MLSHDKRWQPCAVRKRIHFSVWRNNKDWQKKYKAIKTANVATDKAIKRMLVCMQLLCGEPEKVWLKESLFRDSKYHVLFWLYQSLFSLLFRLCSSLNSLLFLNFSSSTAITKWHAQGFRKKKWILRIRTIQFEHYRYLQNKSWKLSVI